MLNKNFFLIGMMGVGKSTVGKFLEKKYNFPIFDMDIEIEKIMDMSINEIFNLYNEEKFRVLEHTLFKNITFKNNFVYSTGGGIVENKKNIKILNNQGYCIFLDCSLEEIKKRIKNDNIERPLYNHQNIDKIYNKRKNIYTMCADSTLDVSSISIEETARIIKRIIDENN